MKTLVILIRKKYLQHISYKILDDNMVETIITSYNIIFLLICRHELDIKISKLNFYYIISQHELYTLYLLIIWTISQPKHYLYWIQP